ncbi:MAG: hypothetical protein Q4D89_13015 [Arachnia propionica]|uniref:hypothetical protein n=1 Tax=Arachnia propionica TaxID=1750 RepID=UPI00270BF9E4|nr:hypothetical protein [Arachnia propionica]
MRRRHFLWVGAVSALSACADTPAIPETVPTPNIPPAPSASTSPPPEPPGSFVVPTSFRHAPTWPTAPVATRITAVRHHWLCGAVLRGEKEPRGQEEAWFPAVVNVKGPSTWILQLDDSGTFATEKVELDALVTPSPGAPVEEDGRGRPLTAGRAVLDEQHAYLVVGVQEAASRYALHVVKVGLGDGAVAATVKIREGIDPHAIRALTLSLDETGRELVLVGTTTLKAPGDHVAVRLVTSDLSVRFDAHDVVADATPVMNHVLGEAIVLTRQDGTRVVVAPLTGSVVEVGAWMPLFVAGEWLYFADLVDDDTEQWNHEAVHVTSLRHDATIDLQDITSHGAVSFRPPQIWSESRALIGAADHEKGGSLWVWRVGAPAPDFRVTAGLDERPPRARAIFGNVLYSGPNDKDTLSDDATLHLRNLGSGTIIAELPLLGNAEALAVTSWGLANETLFYPAIGWS